jgi:hypothetical protein
VSDDPTPDDPLDAELLDDAALLDDTDLLDDTELLDDRELDAALDATDDAIGLSLRALLEPPGDIERRTASTVDRALHGRSALSIGMDLLGLGWRTVATILTDEAVRADEEPEGMDVHPTDEDRPMKTDR